MMWHTVVTFTALASCAIAVPQYHSQSYGAPAPTQEWKTWHHSYPSKTHSSYTSSATTSGTIITSSASLTTSGSTAPTDACASVSALAAAITQASPSAIPRVPAELAYECLNSIPFNQSAAEAYLDSIDPYLNWQTTFEYLADPPADYATNVQPPYDFFATWNAIKANTSSGAYQSEYQFGWTVYRAFQLAHDGHFVVYPDSVTSVFSFGRGLPLVSVSTDGTSAPQPYLYSDVLAASQGDTSFEPSPIVQIDGQDAVSYLLVWSEYGSLQDPDALWNNLFYEPAQVALGSSGTGPGTFSGGGRGRWPYPGPSTTLTFANGSTFTSENYANVLIPFDNITSGADIYSQYFIPPPEAYQNALEFASSLTETATSTANATETSTSTPTATSIPAPGYPTPFVSETNNLNGGYFIDEPGYEDVAVLVVRSFVGTEEDEIPFQAVNTYFIETAAAMGKTKLIVDVSANGGGTILQGYDLFKQLFPSILPYGGNRFRAHEAIDLLGEQYSYLAGLVPRSLDLNDTYLEFASAAFNYRTDLDVNYEPFTSWPDKYGPEALGPEPDNFTNILRWNLSDVLTPINSGGIYISGYLNRTNITAQPFAAENIVILTDGYCASTCTIFSELMTQQGGVKTVALGGRPRSGPIQAIGGVKGSNDYPYEYIYEAIAGAYIASNSSLQAEWQDSVLSDYTALPLYRSNAVVINSRNGYRQGDATNTPLQFVYEAADCRILYTPAMVVDETAVWKTVSDSVWGGGNGDACVAGGFGVGGTAKLASAGRHAAREDVDFAAIVESFGVQTEGFGARGGDSIMMP